MSLTIDGQANSITSSVGGVNIPATVGTLSVGPSGSYMNVTSSGVGIGTLTPQDKLTVLGKIQIQQDDGSNNRIVLRGKPGSSYRYGIDNDSSSNNFRIFREDDATTANGVVYMNIDSSGRVTKPYQPAFRAYYSSRTTTVGSGTFVFDQVDNNIGSHYSTSTGRFTAPISGYYHISCCIQHSGGTSTAGYVDIRKNGGVLYVRNEHTFGAVFSSIGTSVTVYLVAGDYVELIRNAAVFWSDSTSFSGHFLG